MIKFWFVFLFLALFFVSIALTVTSCLGKSDSVILFLTQKLKNIVNSHEINSMIIFDFKINVEMQ